MKLKYGVVTFLILFIFIFSASASEKINVTFNACVDGDTAYFNVDNKKTKFRFLALDTPESVHPKKKVEPFGKEASNFVCDLLKSAKNIEVQYDDNSKKTDKYDRDLAWIFVDDVLLQEKVIENGLGQVAYIYGKYEYLDKLCLVQGEAKDLKKGVWSNDKYKDGYCNKEKKPTKKKEVTTYSLFTLILLSFLTIIVKYLKKR
ncbi:MAG: thermonuclease family protein [Bacilli bacterium]